MPSKRIRIAAAAALLSLAGAAASEELTFHFTGTVTGTLDASLAPIGSRVEGSFSYDPDTAEGIPMSGYAVYQLPTSMSGSVNGHVITSDGLHVMVFDNMGANTEDMVSISGAPIMIDDAVHPGGTFSLTLASISGETDVLRGTGLPTIYHLADFQGGAERGLTYGSLHKDGTETGVIAGFRIDSITGGREPCTNPQGKPKKCKKRASSR